MDKKLCVYAICKNEEKYVKQWYDNVKDADYVCVLDTGSTDKTYKILSDLKKKHPEQIIIKKQSIIPWRFDVARNESMKLIPEDAEILVCTDFDELFSDDNWVQKVKDSWVNVNRVRYPYAWSHNETGARTDIFIYDKIHTRELHWIYPVHEVLFPINEEYKESSVYIEDMYLDHFQDQEKSRKSYFDLLKLSVEENPDNPHVHMLYAREYLINQKYEEALKEYLATLEMPKIDSPAYREVLLESLGRCASIYQKLKNYDEAIWYCQEFIKEDPTYREPYFILAELYNNMKMYTLGEAVAKAGLEYSTRKYSWIERAESWISWGDCVLADSYTGLRKYKEAAELLEKIIENHPNKIQLYKQLVYCYKQILKQNNGVDSNIIR